MLLTVRESVIKIMLRLKIIITRLVLLLILVSLKARRTVHLQQDQLGYCRMCRMLLHSLTITMTLVIILARKLDCLGNVLKRTTLGLLEGT